MFQLIVAVIAIFLVAIMVIAGIYFGGSAHSEAAIKAQYAGNMNAAAQIEGAMQLYYNDHASHAPGQNGELLQFLKDRDYLKDIPEGDWVVNRVSLYKPFSAQQQDVAVCAAMNKVAGFDISLPDVAAEPYLGCPPCNGAEGSPELAMAEAYKGWPGCQFPEAGTP